MNKGAGETNKGDIQVVDDTPENLEILAAMLTKQGYNVRVAINGELALLSARSDPPDLFLLDIMMPGLDGYEVCRILKSDETTRDFPVIFISALDETLDKVNAFSVGGVDYITKPFQEAEVLARVETHLTLRTLQKALEEKNVLLGEKNVQLEAKNVQLEKALANIRTLRGMLPICAKCKKIRDGEGYWNQIETYIENHSHAEFTHGICEECMEDLYGAQEWYRRRRKRENVKAGKRENDKSGKR